MENYFKLLILLVLEIQKEIKEDENITKKISDFFFYELQSINAVCLVINLIIDYQHAKNIYLIVSLIYTVKI